MVVLSGLELKIFGYEKKNLTWPDGSKTVSKVHRHVFMVHYKSLDVPTVYSFGDSWILATFATQRSA